MERFLTLFGPQSITCLFADREFVGVKWFGYLIDHHIDFRIRIKWQQPSFQLPRNPRFRRKSLSWLTRGGYQVLSGKRQLWGHSLYIIGLKMADGGIGDYRHPRPTRNRGWLIIKNAGKLKPCSAGLKTRGFWFGSHPYHWPETTRKLLAFLAIAFCWSHLVGEWLHEVKPITLKNHGRPAQSLFPLWIRLSPGLFIPPSTNPPGNTLSIRLSEQLFKRLGWSPQRADLGSLVFPGIHKLFDLYDI